MQTNKFDFSVTDIEIENKSLAKSNIGCYIAYNGQDLDCIIVDDTDHRLVLDLPDPSAVIRVTAKGLGNDGRIGSVSIKASTFIDYAQKSTKETWITLFDHEDDDEYDGQFNEDDQEAPRIKVSFTRGTKATKRKKGKKVKTTTTITKTVTRTEQTVSKDDIRRFNIENLRTDLKDQLASLIEALRNDQTDIDVENKERVGTLANLETVHAELKGENDQDEAFTIVINDLKNEITKNLAQHRADIEARKQELLNTIKNLDAETKKSNQEKTAAEKEKARLTGIVETPEDLTESGFSKEAKTLRKDNGKLRSEADKHTADLLSARDNRNELINQHKELVGEFEGTVLSFHDDLRKVAQTKRSLAFEKAGLQKELEFHELESDFFRRKLEGGEIDATSLTDAMTRLTNEYAQTDGEYNRHTDQLRKNLRNQEFILSGLFKNLRNTQDHTSDTSDHKKRQDSEIDHIQNELKNIEDIGYEKQFTEVSGSLRKLEEERKVHQDQLEKAHADLQAKINIFADDLAGRQRERDDQAEKVNNALKDLQDVTVTINGLLKEIEELENKHFTDDNRDRVHENLSTEREAIENKLRFANDERNKIRGELDEAVRTLDDKHRLVEDQKRRIEQLRRDIDELKQLIEEKKRIIAQLEADIHTANEEIERLKNEIAELQAQADDLERRIRELEALGGTPKDLTYKAVRGDEVDELLAQYIQNCPVPVKRLGGGFYLFGTRKIYAKIMNGKIVIRVGGGYMVVQEFIESYAEAELAKINAILEREGLTSVDQIDLEEYCLKGNKTAYGNTRGEASPGSKGGNFNNTGSFKNSMNGTGRSPKGVKTSQIVSGK
jgi:chromosome segregation ATPase